MKLNELFTALGDAIAKGAANGDVVVRGQMVNRGFNVSGVAVKYNVQGRLVYVIDVRDGDDYEEKTSVTFW